MKIFGRYLRMLNFAFTFLVWLLCLMLVFVKPIEALNKTNNYDFNGNSTGWTATNDNGTNVCGNTSSSTANSPQVTLAYNANVGGQSAFQAISGVTTNTSYRGMIHQTFTAPGTGSVNMLAGFRYYANASTWHATANTSWIRLDIYNSTNSTFVASVGCVSFNSNQAWTYTSAANFTLTGGTTYTMRATLKSQTRNGSPSAITLGIDDIALYSAPTGLSASAPADTTNVSLSWTTSTAGTGAPGLHASTPYRVYRSTSTPVTTSNFLANATTNSYTDSTTVGNTLYYYAITDFDTLSVESALSAEVSQRTLPGTPTSLNFTNITGSAMRVNWTPPSGGASSYKVERCQGTGCTSYAEIATGVTNAYYDDSGLTGSTIYRYRVRGTNATGNGSYSTAAEQSTASPGVSGVIYVDEIGTVYNCANNNLTIALRVDGAGTGSGTCTSAAGTYSVTASYSSSSTVHLFIDGENVVGSTVIMPTSGDSITGVAIYLNRVNLPTPAQSAITNTLLNYYDNTEDSDMNFSVASGVLTVEDGSKLVIDTGQTFDPNGNVIAPAIEVKGTFTPEGNTIELNAAGTSTTCTDPAGLVMPFCINGGTFTYGTSTVRYTGTTTSTTQTFWPGTADDDGVDWNGAFYSNGNPSSPGGSWTPTTSSLTVADLGWNGSTFAAVTTGLRYRGITIPKNATITNATFDARVAIFDAIAGQNISVRGRDEANLAVFSSSNRPGTGSFTSSTSWTLGVEILSADSLLSSSTSGVPPAVTSIIQTIINRSDWVTGNSLGLVFSNDFDNDLAIRPYEYATGSDWISKLSVTTNTSGVTVAGTSYYSLEVGTAQDTVTGTTYTLGGITSVYGSLTLGNASSTNSDTLSSGNNNLSFYGTDITYPFNITSKGTFSPGTGTVNFYINDSGSSHLAYVPATSYYNLVIDPGTGTVDHILGTTSNQTINVSNSFSMSEASEAAADYVTANTGLTLNVNNITVGSNVNFEAPSTNDDAHFVVSGDMTITGTLTPRGGKVYFMSADAAASLSGNLSFYDVKFFDDGTNIVYTLNSDMTVADDIEIYTATLDVSATPRAISITDDWINIGGMFDARTGTVTFSGNGANRIIDSGCSDASTCTSQDFYNLVINTTSNTETVTLTDNLKVAGTLTITSGDLIQDTYNVRSTGATAVSIGANGKWTNISTGDLALGGAFTNNGSVVMKGNNGCGGSDVILITSTSGTPTWSGSGTFDMSDVSVANQNAGVAITVISGTDAGGNTGTWTFQSSCGAGSLTSDIVDSGGTPVGSPSVNMSSVPFSVTYETSTGTFGVSAERIRINNTTGNPQWSLSIAATNGPTALWNATTYYYDFNDTTANAGDGGDTDTYGGRMSINPASATLSPQSGCNNTGLTLGTSSGFAEGTTNSITLVTAGASAGTNCYWDLTNIDISQTIPAEQTQGSYTIDMTVSVVAI